MIWSKAAASFFRQRIWRNHKPPAAARIECVGRGLKHAPRFAFFLIPSRVHTRLHTGKANRWAVGRRWRTVLQYMIWMHRLSFLLAPVLTKRLQ